MEKAGRQACLFPVPLLGSSPPLRIGVEPSRLGSRLAEFIADLMVPDAGRPAGLPFPLLLLGSSPPLCAASSQPSVCRTLTLSRLPSERRAGLWPNCTGRIEP
jgi:hypothetical protein